MKKTPGKNPKSEKRPFILREKSRRGIGKNKITITKITISKRAPARDWAPFFARYDRIIKGVIRNFQRKNQTAFDEESAAQEIRLAVISEIQNFDPKKGNMSKFVGHIAFTRLIDYIRSQHTTRRSPEGKIFSLNDKDVRKQELFSDARRTAPTILEEAAREENRIMVARVLDELSTLHQNILRMRYMDEQPIGEIAARLEMSRDQLKRQTGRAIHAFRTVYRQLYPSSVPKKAA